MVNYSHNLYYFTFPLVAYNRDILHFARNNDEITICTLRGLKNGFYKNLKIIDSAGKLYEIKDAIKIGYSGYLWGFNIFKGQKIKLDLIINDVYDCSVELLKEKVLKTFEKNQYFWNSDGELEQRRNYVIQAKKHLDILKYLSKYFYTEK